MISGVIQIDKEVFLNQTAIIDCSRFNLTSDEGEITLLEIKQNSTASFIDCTSDKKLIFNVSGSGSQTASCRITTTLGVQTFTANYSIVDESSLNLLCDDSDLDMINPDVMKFLPIGRSSWTKERRLANKKVFDWLFSKKILKDDGSKLTEADIPDTEEFMRMAAYWSLYYIYSGLSNQVDDIFNRKAKEYKDEADLASAKALLTLDLGSGAEQKDMAEIRLVRG